MTEKELETKKIGIIQYIPLKRDGLKIDDVYYNCFPNDKRIKGFKAGDEVMIDYEDQPKRDGGVFHTIITICIL